MRTFVLAFTLIRDGWKVEAVRAPRTYGRYFTPLVPLFRPGTDSRLPEDVRSMLSTREVLLARTLVFLARNAGGWPAPPPTAGRTRPPRSLAG